MGNKVSSYNGFEDPFKKQPRIHEPSDKKRRKLNSTRTEILYQYIKLLK